MNSMDITNAQHSAHKHRGSPRVIPLYIYMYIHMYTPTTPGFSPIHSKHTPHFIGMNIIVILTMYMYWYIRTSMYAMERERERQGGRREGEMEGGRKGGRERGRERERKRERESKIAKLRCS